MGGSWHVRINDKAPHVKVMMDKCDDWVKAMEGFIEAVKHYESEQLDD